jgi:eukaryotic-like serine/threonine-protein kinase
VLRFVKYLFLGLVLLLVCFTSALLSMRFAIHGREVRVPRFVGLSPVDAERLAIAQGILISMDSRFYSSDIPAGYVVSQAPEANAKVRRGWRVRLALSLGTQRGSIPNVLGESERAAELNISRRDLEIGAIATMHSPGAQSATVIAQSPPPDARNAISPKVALLLAAPENTRVYIMPNFVGQTIGDGESAVRQAGFTLGKVGYVQDFAGPSGIIVKQTPPPGRKVISGATVAFEVRE